MSKARAAQIWAGLERFLIERCGLPDGRMLDRDRPELIRAIGDELVSTKTVGQKSAVAGQKPAAKSVSPPLPKYQSFTPRVKHAQQARWPDTVHDPRLAAMLERSCSRRMGYDGDDEVTHAGSR